jgi:hypothetical protein
MVGYIITPWTTSEVMMFLFTLFLRLFRNALAWVLWNLSTIVILALEWYICCLKGASSLQGCGLQSDVFSLTFDIGASQCLIGIKYAFLEFNPDGAEHLVVKGIAQGLAIVGEGIVE